MGRTATATPKRSPSTERAIVTRIEDDDIDVNLDDDNDDDDLFASMSNDQQSSFGESANYQSSRFHRSSESEQIAEAMDELILGNRNTQFNLIQKT